ncbi:MAG: D-glycerate dehydrogenase, partial [Burkholderiales bacterium]|nr:D-glycerate dehydrogenase [Burkholderiales bacterium]
MKPRVLVSREVFDETLALLAEHFEVDSNQADVKRTPEQFAAALADKDGAVISTSDRIDGELLDRCPRLKVVSNVGVGYNNLDLAALTAHGVMATNTPDVLTDSVADYTFGMIIATCRRMTEGEHFLRAGEWKASHLKQMLGSDVHGATLGIIGFGRIGQAVAKRARGFDMKILYHNRSRLKPAEEAQFGAHYRGKHDLLREADIVVLLTPYSAESHHTIGAAELALMKPTAVLINMARGGIVDDAALIEALKAKRIQAAGLDVYENEPALNPG